MKTRIDMVALLASLSQRGVAVVLTTHDFNGVAAHRAIDETPIRAFTTRDGLLLAEYSWPKAVVDPREIRILANPVTWRYSNTPVD